MSLQRVTKAIQIFNLQQRRVINSDFPPRSRSVDAQAALHGTNRSVEPESQPVSSVDTGRLCASVYTPAICAFRSLQFFAFPTSLYGNKCEEGSEGCFKKSIR